MTQQPWYLLRDSRFKLVADADSLIPRLLFDMEKDPEENRKPDF